jgi:hypothetical protein
VTMELPFLPTMSIAGTQVQCQDKIDSVQASYSVPPTKKCVIPNKKNSEVNSKDVSNGYREGATEGAINGQQ